MLAALRDEPSVQAVLPFARMWYARESRYVWAAGDRSHCILQAEGGEQGDPLMPAMFSLALRPALRALQSELQPGEQALAYLDDIYILAPPSRVAELYRRLEQHLLRHAHIRLKASEGVELRRPAATRCARPRPRLPYLGRRSRIARGGAWSSCPRRPGRHTGVH